MTLLEMPDIKTDGVRDGQMARHLREAVKAVDEGPRIGIEQERHNGVVPIYKDRDPPYAGVTEFGPKYTREGIDVESKRVGINDRMPTYVKIGNKIINKVGRTGRHELSHVLSEKLLRYMDVPDHTRTLIMESFAEFSDVKRGNRDEVLLTTPYHNAVRFAYLADMFYESKRDGKKGYAMFIRDIQRYRSADRAMANLRLNIKEAMENGVDVPGTLRSVYDRDVIGAHKRAGIDLTEYKRAA